MKFKRVTEKEFKKLRALLEAGLQQSVVVKATGRSTCTMSQIAKSNTFADYKKLLQLTSQKYQKQPTVRLADGYKRVEETDETESVVSLLKDIRDLIVAQNATLHQLEALWEYPADFYKRKAMDMSHLS